ncbi:holin [Mycobacterium phage ThetaBob]|uniref:Holin n=1 Tax=Mycobacterium phage ThetaBob TaxID=2588513 RepID=A0A4Y6EVF8_9CAUD|nr:holin [Mycobacterium phage ThetaBob]QDF19919.1 hypothetical protein SEA_THETABOB_32 [Mycobacterium phage ThetaBob]
MWTLTFWKDTAERVLSTFAIALLGVVGAEKFDLFHADWKAALGLAGGQAFLSLLKALGVLKLPIGTPGSATPVDLTEAKRDELGT